jgi:hypothetical protein
VWPEQWVRVVVDPLDDARLSDDLEGRTDILGGIAVVRPVPGATTPARFAVDLLTAMGKHHEALEGEGQAHRSWHMARLWLQAEHLRHLVVLDADRLPATLWRLLAELAGHLRMRLWLVVRNAVDPSPFDVLGLWRQWTTSELLDRLPPISPAGTVDLPGEEIPLPADGLLTFRASCSELLLPEQFAKVDALYRDAFCATRDWNRALAPGDRAAIVGQLRTLTIHSSSATETRIRVHAAQAAHFVDGTLVKVGKARWPGRVDVPQLGLSRHLARRLRRIVTPAWACALALTAATAHWDNDLVALTMGDLDDDGREGLLAGERFDIPAHAAALVRAQLLVRQDADARDTDPLFVDRQGRGYGTGRHLGEGLEQATPRGAAWWPGPRGWPLRDDDTASGYWIEVHRVGACRSLAARLCRYVDVMSPPASVCAAFCRPHGAALNGVPTPTVAEAAGLVCRRQGHLHPSPRVEYSLCLTAEPPSRRTAIENTTPATVCCALGAFSSDMALLHRNPGH